jgi:mycothiol system anti-sigma-R factor
MNCREATDHLYEFLDAELTPETTAQIRRHLRECAPCLEHFSFEEAFLRFLEARAAAAGAPPELRRRILERLLLEPGGSTPESG